MKNRKYNLDRPQIDSKEIQAGMNFSQLMVSYQVMAKPFYKSNWFFGTTGLASIGLIVGGTLALQSSDETEKQQIIQLITDAPPEYLETIPEIENSETETLILSPDFNQTLKEETQTIQPKNNQTQTKKHDKIITPEKETTQIISTESTDKPIKEVKLVSEAYPKETDLNRIDISPRINGKLDGNITREDLLDNRGITTGSDVSIIHFELHLIDGLGGKVFEEESNQLNSEMKTAILNVSSGETIYFENIRGRTSDGKVVRLNPLRYVLLN